MRLAKLAAAATALLTAACASQVPEQRAGLRGVGTPGVSDYVGEDRAGSLQAMEGRCQTALRQAAAEAGLRAACDQLQRTMHNQPGNTVDGAPES